MWALLQDLKDDLTAVPATRLRAETDLATTPTPRESIDVAIDANTEELVRQPA
jgi:hypothetical protein